jgi:Mg2+/Co2+ transporter CorB
MTPLELGISLVVIAALIFLSALFSGLETALFSLRRHQLRRLEANHPALTKFVQLFRDKPRRVLNGLLVGDAVVKVPLVVFCLFLLWRGPSGSKIPQWLAAVVIFAIVVLLCDLIP